MIELILILVAITLFILWIALVRFEVRRGRRFFPRLRAALDGQVMQVTDHAARAEVGAVIATGTRKGLDRVLHDIAHLSLIAVRAVERVLTQTVRSLRTKRAENAAPQAPSFASNMKDFKNELRNGTGAEEPTPGGH